MLRMDTEGVEMNEPRLALVIEPRKEHYRKIGKVITVEDNPGSDLCKQYILLTFEHDPYRYWFMDSEIRFLNPSPNMSFDSLVDVSSV